VTAWWASVITVVRGEPLERLERMLDRLRRQAVGGEVELVLAAPGDEHGRLESLRPGGAITRIVLVDNPTGARTTGLNLAIAQAEAPIIHRIDARSLPTPDHLARSDARLAADPQVGVVGGRQHPVALAPGTVAHGVARALANPWMLGGPAYRRAGASGAVDTVYLGSFRRAELLNLGGYDEHLDANEDFELCERYLASGATVWLEEGLVVDYEARARFGDVWRQYEAFGRAKVQFWRRHASRPNGRQLTGLAAPVLAVGAAIALAPRPRARVAAGIAAAGALAAVDHVAGAGPAGPAERAVAIGAGLVIPTAWAAGAYREFLRR
jgi:hypothetical protein